MEQNNDKNVLRCITYLTPSYPIELFHLIMQYLEDKLNFETLLTVESRWSGPIKSRVDPFAANLCDIGFVCSAAYLRYINEGSQCVDLIPVGAVFKHRLAQERPVYFGEVIVRKNRKDSLKEFSDLKGCNFAFNDHESLSGTIVVLDKLKDMGENASFFSNVVKSGSHLNSIEMVLSGQVDAACVDSNVLSIFKLRNPQKASNVLSLHLMAPMPIFPLLANRNLPTKVKEGIKFAMLRMSSDPVWGSRLVQFGVEKFMETSPSLYQLETNLREAVKSHSLRPAFY